MKLYQFILPIFFLFQSFAVHKYYVSVMEIHNNKKENKMDVILRTFPDDVERAIKDIYNSDSKDKNYNKLLLNYIKQNIRFAFDNNEVDYNIIGTTTENEFMVILIDFPIPQNAEKLQVYNSFLTDEYDEQKNIVHYITSNDKSSYILTKKNYQTEIELKP